MSWIKRCLVCTMVIMVGSAISTAQSPEDVREESPVKPELTDEDKWYDLTVQYALAYRQQQYDRAMELAKEALLIAQTAFDDQDARTAQLLNDMGKIENSREHNDEALKYHKRALELREQIFPEETPPIVQSKTNLAKTHFALRNFKTAREILEDVLPLLQDRLGTNHAHVGSILTFYGEVLWSLEDFEGARDAFAEAVEVLERHTVDGEPLIEALEWYAQSLGRLGFTEESQQVQQRVNLLKQGNLPQIQ